MAKKNKANKYWIYDEDAGLAARFTKYLANVLYARRASYVRAKMAETAHEISIEECSVEIDDVYNRLVDPVEENVEAKLMWEGIRNYLPKLTPKECEVMIALYVNRLSVSEAAAKLGVKPNTVSTHLHNHRRIKTQKSRNVKGAVRSRDSLQLL